MLIPREIRPSEPQPRQAVDRRRGIEAGRRAYRVCACASTPTRPKDASTSTSGRPSPSMSGKRSQKEWCVVSHDKVKAGSVLTHGITPYGYREVEEEGRFALVVYEPEAEVVRLIYHYYVEGDANATPMNLSDIARGLTSMKIPTHSDTCPVDRGWKKRGQGEWSRSVIYEILKNETYKGVWRYGKTKCSNGKRVQTPQETHLIVRVPPIVSEPMWEAVQERLAENRQNSRRNRKRDYLLSGRVICGDCGLKMTGKANRATGHPAGTSLYYQCPGHTSTMTTARKCNLTGFRVDRVDAAVWGWAKSLLSDPEALKRGLDEHQAQCERETEPIRGRLKVIDDLLAENRTQLERLLDLYLSARFPKEILSDREARLETTIKALERERVVLVAHLQKRTLTPGQIRSLQGFAAKASRGLNLANADFAEKRRVIEDLDVRVTLAVENGQKVAHVSCILRPIEETLSVGSGRTKPALWQA